MKLTRKEFKKLFPNLAKEMQTRTGTMSINSVRTETSESKASYLTSYDPDVIDFLRRCNTKREGEEIIDFMEKRGEISHEYAEKLRNQLESKGIRSFGPKKEVNYYFRVRK